MKRKMRERTQLANFYRQARELIAGKIKRFQAGELAQRLRQTRELIVTKENPSKAGELV